VRDPVGGLRKIYAFAGLTFTNETEERIGEQQQEENNIHHKYGKHEYRLEDFGLEPNDLQDPAFDLYRPISVQ